MKPQKVRKAATAIDYQEMLRINTTLNKKLRALDVCIRKGQVAVSENGKDELVAQIINGYAATVVCCIPFELRTSLEVRILAKLPGPGVSVKEKQFVDDFSKKNSENGETVNINDAYCTLYRFESVGLIERSVEGRDRSMSGNWTFEATPLGADAARLLEERKSALRD